MNRKFVVAIVAMFVSTTWILAQAPPQMPKPGPEHKRLEAFVGNWTFEGDAKPGPMGPGGKMTGTDRIEWIPGGFFVVRNYEVKGAMGEAKGVEVMGYNSSTKMYTYNFFDGMGVTGSGTGSIRGNTWNFTGETQMGAQKTKDRCTLSFANPATSFALKCETSMDGTNWMPTFEGKGTKSR